MTNATSCVTRHDDQIESVADNFKVLQLAESVKANLQGDPYMSSIEIELCPVFQCRSGLNRVNQIGLLYYPLFLELSNYGHNISHLHLINHENNAKIIFHKEFLHELKNLPKLTEMHLSNFYVPELGLNKSFWEEPKVTSLIIENCMSGLLGIARILAPENMFYLKNLTNLERLKIINIDDTLKYVLLNYENQLPLDLKNLVIEDHDITANELNVIRKNNSEVNIILNQRTKVPIDLVDMKV